MNLLNEIKIRKKKIFLYNYKDIIIKEKIPVYEEK